MQSAERRWRPSRNCTYHKRKVEIEISGVPTELSLYRLGRFMIDAMKSNQPMSKFHLEISKYERRLHFYSLYSFYTLLLTTMKGS